MSGWSLCIATLNRRDALLATLGYALAQSRPPAQIVVVDASEDWQQTRALAEALVAERGGALPVRLDYGTSAVRSSATQRNTGIGRCTEDVVFLLDDDSFLYPDCAERIMAVYEADTGRQVAGVAARLVPGLPPAAGSAPLPQKKRSGRTGGGGGLRGRVIGTRLGRWFNRRILFQNMNELFIRYDGLRQGPVPATLAGQTVVPVSFMPGSAMTVRREVAEREPFDTALRFYAAFEDLDATYRYARHGLLLQAPEAKLHHFEAAGGRMKRKKVIVFQLFNMLVFLKRHAADPEAWLPEYRSMLRRRLLGEFLKDLLSGRLGFPQAAGVVTVMRRWRQVWAQDRAALDDWYPGFQKAIIDDM